MSTIGLVLASYLVGAIPFGLLVARRVANVDVRKVGSGNIGATNVARAAGKQVAALVLLLDALKGFVPAAAAAWWLADPVTAAVVGLAAFLGHCFPIYLRFRGGKGVATALGVSLALVPWAALAGALAYAGLFRAFRVSSVGSLGGAAVATGVGFAVANDPAYAWAIVVMVLVIVVRHTSNIRRLIRREESKI